jgi:dienelactone hydrolase
MALFVDLLFNRAYGVPWPEVDDRLLSPFLRDTLGCEDEPSLLAFAGGKQPGRLAISPRDFARFGLLYLRQGRWGDRQVLPSEEVRLALGSPLPAALPRAGTNAAALLPGQRTLGSRRLPDNQTEHFGSYSFLWWVNGLESDGRRHWPDAPTNTFAALGHGGIRGLAVFPNADLVVSWNDSRIDSPAKENQAFQLLAAAIGPANPKESVPDPSSPATNNLSPASVFAPSKTPAPAASSRLRVVIETDAGGDPDDEQSLVRFLLYANEWDIEGIIANRPVCRDRENLNPERTGLGVVLRLIQAYADCWPNLVRYDPRYPSPDLLRSRVVPGYDTTESGVELLLKVLDRSDPRPVWYSDWGSDRGSATNNLRRTLDRALQERGKDGYARLKQKIRLSSADKFADHTRQIPPAFPLWVDPWNPTLEGRRWYHRFSALTATAGGFDLVRDVLTDHGPLGALYPTNTTHWGKEGDSLSFLYLVPNGLNSPEHPGWGGWGGRLAHGQETGPGWTPASLPYFHASVADTWNGTTHRDNTLARWAVDLQNDFRARLDACLPRDRPANHPPRVHLTLSGDFLEATAKDLSPGNASPGTVKSLSPRQAEEVTKSLSPGNGPGGDAKSLSPTPSAPRELVVQAGASIRLSVGQSTDPDGDPLGFEWIPYREPGTWQGPVEFTTRGATLEITAPPVSAPETLHWVARVTDQGTPALSRYARVVLTVLPGPLPPGNTDPARSLSLFLAPPPEFAEDFGNFRPLLRFHDGRPVRSLADWAERRREILAQWHGLMGAWPALLEQPRMEVLSREPRENFEQRRVRVQVAADQTAEGWLLVPTGGGPFPAVFVPFYEPETSIGRDRPMRDFALQLARRGFVTLALGSPGGDARKPDTGTATCQPLSFLGYFAANCANALARLPEVDARRLGIVGHSYGGKWALFGASLCDLYACGVWSDPGIVWDESRSNVNYWEAWYLGRELEPGPDGIPPVRKPGIPSPANPRTGAYARLVRHGLDLHELMGLMAPRPFLVSGGAEDPPERWRALNHVRAVNRLFGETNRVAFTTRPTHEPTPESNEQIYAFFEFWLKPRPTAPPVGGPPPTVP